MASLQKRNKKKQQLSFSVIPYLVRLFLIMKVQGLSLFHFSYIFTLHWLTDIICSKFEWKYSSYTNIQFVKCAHNEIAVTVTLPYANLKSKILGSKLLFRKMCVKYILKKWLDFKRWHDFALYKIRSPIFALTQKKVIFIFMATFVEKMFGFFRPDFPLSVFLINPFMINPESFTFQLNFSNL